MPVIQGNTGGGRPIIRVALLPILPKLDAVSAGETAVSMRMLECRALLDTGADGTSVCRSAALAAGLRSYGKRPVIGVGGLAYHRTWAAFIGFFPDSDPIETSSLAPASGAPHVLSQPFLAIEIQDGLGFEVIIGRDVLTLGTFIMRPGGAFEFDIPSNL